MKTALVLAFSILSITWSFAQSPNDGSELLFAPDQPAPPEQPCVTLSNDKNICGQADNSGSQLLSIFKGVQYGQAARWQPSSVFDEYEPMALRPYSMVPGAPNLLANQRIRYGVKRTAST